MSKLSSLFPVYVSDSWEFLYKNYVNSTLDKNTVYIYGDVNFTTEKSSSPNRQHEY